jgi:polysaccharide deacetylase family protein (PEP-CTERM system associated)
MDSTKYILLTVDVEDWFQVENFKRWIPFSTWDSRELRVERNVHRLLDLLDSVELAGRPEAEWHRAEGIVHSEVKDLKWGSGEVEKWGNPHQPATNNLSSEFHRDQQQATEQPFNNPQPTTDNIQTKKVHATFFVLGWIAKKLPSLVREIQSRGHEVASHGFNHELPSKLSVQDLRNDLITSKKILEDTIGKEVTGYRAPSFAINDDILKTIGECGYQYDSSYNSFSMHGRYGQISLNGSGSKGIAHRINENFYELPISNFSLSTLGILAHFRHFRQFHLPWGGGCYFRLIPLRVFKTGVNAILNKQGTYLFYMHPWEIDQNQPRVQKASANFKFRHYANLGKTGDKLRMVIDYFSNCQFITCNQYLSVFA